MASSFPGAIDSFVDPLSTSPLSSPSHALQHQNINDAVEKIETYMGLVKVIPTSATNGTVGATGTVTIGNAVSSVTVNGAFSALYTNYKIIVNGGTSNTPQAIALHLGSTTSGNLYDYVLNYWNFSGTPTVTATGVGNNFAFVGEASTTSVLIDSDIFFPQVAQNTFFTSRYLGSVVGNFNGRLRNTTQYTDFTISVAGTLTGGTIRVYGYRN